MNPVVWTIAGSDSCGGAGITADLTTFHNLGVHGCQVLTAVTSQNVSKIIDIFHLPATNICQQIEALLHMHPAAVKIGMMGNVEVIAVIKNFLQRYSGFSVLDPIFISSSGKNLFLGAIADYREHLLSLLPHIYLLTPNIMEAEQLLQMKMTSFDDIEKAGRQFISLGVKNVLIKGGHFPGEFSQDFWTNGSESYWLTSRRHTGKDCHGTGCVTASAIAACLAHRYDIKDALVVAKMYVSRGIRLSNDYFHHAHGWPEDSDDFPFVSSVPFISMPPAFNGDDQYHMGLYPIVDSVEWLQKLLPLGVKHIQLRIKNLSGTQLEEEIRRAIALAQSYEAKLYINDYWELAIHYGAYGVHLGQEDLCKANIATIQAAGLRLGISTHCYFEAARAHAVQPSYIACGPVFPTNSKVMKFLPQGIQSLQRWRQTLPYPLVAIGGIDAGNIDDVMCTKVDGAAMISAITHAADPEKATYELLSKVNPRAA